jgi:hypothetical protein
MNGAVADVIANRKRLRGTIEGGNLENAVSRTTQLVIIDHGSGLGLIAALFRDEITVRAWGNMRLP